MCVRLSIFQFKLILNLSHFIEFIGTSEATRPTLYVRISLFFFEYLLKVEAKSSQEVYNLNEFICIGNTSNGDQADRL